MSGLEVGGPAIPKYTWADGYHINGGNAIGSTLEQRVFPALEALPRPAFVADFGCGEGRIRDRAPYWATRSYKFRGYDISAAAVGRYNRLEIGHTPDRAEVADLTKLDVREERFQAGLLWRVLHAIPNNLHQEVLTQVASTLESGAILYVAARSERDWVVEDLKDKGLYNDGEMNDCYPAMAEALDSEGVRTWPLYFFREGELASVGTEVGLEVVYEESMNEPSGYAILRDRHPLLSYDYVEFRRI